MATQKKQLTAKQKQTKYRALQYTTFVSEFISIFTPFIIMGIANKDEWFTTEEGWKVGLGGSLALALLGLAVLGLMKKKEEDKKEGEKFTYGFISLIVGWFAVAFVFMLLASIMEQITTIMLFGGLGLIGAFGLDIASHNFKDKADLYKKTIQAAKENVVKQQVEDDLKGTDVRF